MNLLKEDYIYLKGLTLEDIKRFVEKEEFFNTTSKQIKKELLHYYKISNTELKIRYTHNKRNFEEIALQNTYCFGIIVSGTSRYLVLKTTQYINQIVKLNTNLRYVSILDTLDTFDNIILPFLISSNKQTITKSISQNIEQQLHINGIPIEQVLIDFKTKNKDKNKGISLVTDSNEYNLRLNDNGMFIDIKTNKPYSISELSLFKTRTYKYINL